MRRLLVALVATVVALTLAPTAWAAPPLSGTLTLSNPAPVLGESVTFYGEIEGKLRKNQKAEVAIACIADGVMVLQGAVLPGQSVLMPYVPADCEAHLRVVEMVKSGVYVLDTFEFSVAG